MSKPPGIAFRLQGGIPTMHVTSSDRATDAIWEAVEAATEAGWTPEQFRREAAQAWDHAKSEERKRDNAAWRTP